VALVHDVGSPPFGHAGEEALQGLMEAHGGFEHNLQALRVVDFLESPYPKFHGLNLTWEVREGIAKHSRGSFCPGPPALFDGVRGERWPSLEAQLADACDEIAYNAHDLDDGLTAGLITLAELERVPLWKRLGGTHDHVNLTPEQAKYLGVRALINEQVQNVARTVRGGWRNGVSTPWRPSAPRRAAPPPSAPRWRS
jgi:dGTPase